MRVLSGLGVASIVVLLAGASAAMGGQVYSSEASFLAKLESGYYLEDFSSYAYGSPLDGTAASLTQDYSGGSGYQYRASALSALYSNESALSTNSVYDALKIEFTGAPVTAVGGIFTATDVSGGLLASDVVIKLSDGTTVILDNPTSSSFWGYTSDVAITSMTLDAPDSPNFAWPTLDHFYVGSVSATAIPLPAAAWAGLGLMGAMAVRRVVGLRK